MWAFDIPRDQDTTRGYTVLIQGTRTQTASGDGMGSTSNFEVRQSVTILPFVPPVTPTNFFAGQYAQFDGTPANIPALPNALEGNARNLNDAGARRITFALPTFTTGNRAAAAVIQIPLDGSDRRRVTISEVRGATLEPITFSAGTEVIDGVVGSEGVAGYTSYKIIYANDAFTVQIDLT